MPGPGYRCQFAAAFDGFALLAEEDAVAARSRYLRPDLDEKAARASVVLIEAMYGTRQTE